MDKVWLSYDKIHYVLNEITMSVKQSTNYTIIGQSGSGKSTLLKLINGLLIPSKGKITVFGMTPNKKNKQFLNIMKKIGYIPQSFRIG